MLVHQQIYYITLQLTTGDLDTEFGMNASHSSWSLSVPTIQNSCQIVYASTSHSYNCNF